MRSFTPAQQLSIATTDRNLLVSAGAGAGKTATLVERIFHLLTAKPHRCSLDELLVVTFSRAAAQEMRSRLVERIQAALASQQADGPTREHLANQMVILPRAAISTIHSFCLSVITSHPDRAGLAPGFDLMSQEEERLYRREFLLNKVEETLARTDSDCLKKLLEQFDPLGGIDQLIAHVTGFHEFLGSLPRPEKFCADALALVTDAGNGAPSPTAMALVNEYLAHRLGRIERLLAPALKHEAAGLHANLHEQLQHIREISLRLVEGKQAPSKSTCLDNLIGLIMFPRLKPIKDGATERDEEFRALRDDIKDELKKICESLNAFTQTELIADFFSCGGTLKFFLMTLGLQWQRELFEAHVKIRRLTFSHLEQLALKILVDENDAPTAVARAYQRQFRHVLVDEFQDVNELQNHILRSVSRPTGADIGGNLFAVGDVKQSIYEFRQADSSLFLEMYRNATAMELGATSPADSRVNLRENFRSHPELLEELNKVFRLLLTKETVGLDYDPEHAFLSGRSPDARPRKPVFSMELLPKNPVINGAAWDDEISAESVRIAEVIAQIGPPWKDICILLRSTVGSAGDLMEALRRRNIPLYCDSRAGFLTAVEVIEFQTILKAINNPFDEIALLGTLRGPAARWNEEELLLLRDVDRHALLIDNLEAAAADSTNALSRKCHEFLSELRGWQDSSSRLPMREFFAMLFDDLHLIEQASVRPGGDQRRLNLLQMLEHARQFDSFLRKGLGEFLKFLDDLIANDEDFSPPSPLAPVADVVRIMSVHKSKGMQFPIVIFPFLGKQFNEANLRRPFLYDRKVGVATNLRDEKSERENNPALFEIVKRERQARERAEELRLLYVAMTRAEEALYLFGSTADPIAEITEIRDNAGDSPELSSAKRPLDILYPWLISRFSELTEKDSGINATDGITSFVATNTFPASAASENQNNSDSDSVPITPFAAAWGRIEALGKKQQDHALRAKISVSEAKRAFDAARDSETPAFHPTGGVKKADALEWLPKPPGAADARTGLSRGKATHRFLANCDLVALARGEKKLAHELARLTEEGFITAEEHAGISLPDIAWFLNGELGRRLTATMGKNFREKAFICKIDAGELRAPKTTGFVILQGVMDLLFKEEKGWVLIDYKTDFCGAAGERIPELIESYTPQLQLYRVLVERTLKQSVAETWIVFLQGHRTFRVPENDLSHIRWEAVVEAGAVVYPDVTAKSVKGFGV